MGLLRRFFKFEERGASLKGEIIGGLVTFFAMVYILPTNASMLAAAGMDQMGVFFATALVSALCTILMGMLANFPMALSSGMGMNAYLAFTICSQFPWQEAMILLTVTGLIFFVLTLTPVRLKLVEAIPQGLRAAISIGLGGFILFVGAKGAGLVADDPSTLVTLGDFTSPSVLLLLFGVALTLGLMAFRKVPMLQKLAIPIGLVVTAIVGVVASSILIGVGREEYALTMSGLPIAPWLDPNVSWGVSGFDKVIFFGSLSGELDFGTALVNIFSNPQAYVAIFTLIFVNLFDTTATLLTAGKDAGMIDENGKLVGAQRAMIADAAGALVCGPLGTSTVTSFAESTCGISVGARTGLSSVFVGLLFLISGFAFPIFSIFSYSSVNGVALVVVGLQIVAGNIKSLAKEDGTALISGIFTFVMMILTYSLSNGMALGILSYVVMLLCEGRYKEISWPVYVLSALFLTSFLVTALA